jgi:hypothetical protein
MVNNVTPGPRRLRERTAEGLFAFLPDQERAGAERCAIRLRQELPHQDDLRKNIVLVAYGGGKDSSYTIAFVRAVQLIMFRDHGTTFRIRTVTTRHAGMPRAVVENIDRAYRALGMFDDPDCEMLLVHGTEVSEFRVDAPLPRSVAERERVDILMTGHRTFAEARPTFCNSCNLRMVNSFALAACRGEGVNLIITGDSLEEQRAYAFWVKRLCRQFGSGRAGQGSGRARGGGFKGFMGAVADLSDVYYRDIHESLPPGCVVNTNTPEKLRFFSIYEDATYSAQNHWDLLTRFLNFSFDELAFSFTESDCGNPTLMAHIRGLKCERRYGREYVEGLQEYVSFAVALMRQKEFPQVLIDEMISRYDGPEAVWRQRALANRFAWDAYRITQAQFVCMVYSPFADGLAGLDDFLAREHSYLWKRREDIRALVANSAALNPDLARDLEWISGLTVPQIRVLSERPLLRGAGDRRTLLDAVLDGDPHKAFIKTRHSPSGPLIAELVSGR